VTRGRIRFIGAAALLGLTLVLGCEPLRSGRRIDAPPGVADAEPVAATDAAAGVGGKDGAVTFRLSEGAEDTQAAERPVAAPATPLAEGDVQRVLARLGEPPRAAGQASDFAWRESSLPPPRTGRDVKTAFPPAAAPDGPPEPAAGPLQVLRRAPDGDVALAPNLSLTFSQPMVAVTSQAELARAALPVRLTPEPRGQWRWIGTRTLLFEPELRFPMATEYQVEVPAGTRSASGEALTGAVRWSFRTPAPSAVVVYPTPTDATVRRDPLLFVVFDQRVDPQAVLPHLSLRAGATLQALRLATAEEVSADPVVQRLAREAGEGRWVAFRPASPLPSDTAVVVSVAKGTPSAEGPRSMLASRDWSFRTFGPLKVVDHGCGAEGVCPPFFPFLIRFSSPLDEARLRPEWVRIEPELPGLRVSVVNDRLVVQGRSRGRTTYRVRLAPEIVDTFGQVLGSAETLRFEVGAAEPSLHGSASGFVVLDPDRPARFSVFTVNQPSLKLRVQAVQPEDWIAYRAFVQSRRTQRNDDPILPPGRLVEERIVPIAAHPDELTETSIDLEPYLREGLGQLVLLIEPTTPALVGHPREDIATWVQATRLGLTAFTDATQLVAWASDLRDARPLPDVSLELLGPGVAARTGPDGMAKLELGAAPAQALVARRGSDVALLPSGEANWRFEGWARNPLPDSLRFSVFDDRGIYRPGESVRIKGWVRRIVERVGGDVEALGGAAKRVRWTLDDSRGNQLAEGAQELNAFGAFDLELALPATMNLGQAHLRITTKGSGRDWPHDHYFDVEEFRRPEFEVRSQASEGPHFVGDHANVTVSAAYYAGGGLGDAPVTWTVRAQPGRFAPPNRDDWSFGRWLPWWMELESDDSSLPEQTFAGRTNGAGRHSLRVDFERSDPPQPLSVTAEATVMDVNRQAWAAETALLVHPADLYVGLRTARPFLALGDAIEVDAIVTDLDGRAVAGRPVALRAERMEWIRQQGEWREQVAERQDCAVTSQAEGVRCAFRASEGGIHQITAQIADAAGRPNQSQLRIWVAGGRLPQSPALDQQQVELVPDKKEYRAGDTAELLVVAPFFPAEGVLTLRRSGLVRSQRFSVSGPTHTLQVPIEDGFTPNVEVHVDLVGSAARTDASGAADAQQPRRPAFARGELELRIPPLARTLRLAVTPRARALEPGGSTRVDVELRNAAGQPVRGAEVALVVVDEAVLALTDYALPDPLADFYEPRASKVASHHLRSHVVLQTAPPENELRAQAQASYRSGADEVVITGSRMRSESSRYLTAPAGSAQSTPIRVRKDFTALALFAPSLRTDASGRAQAELTLPDNLTRYRVMAIGVSGGNQFGSGESTLTARRSLMVRPSPPRFLNFGDRFELPVVVQNQTDQALSVDVAVRAQNAELTAGAGRRVRVPAQDRVEIRFPAAARRAGRAHFQLAAAAGRLADAAEVELPVWTPATTEAFATYGQIDAGAIAQPVQAPPDVVEEFGGLEVTTSSTALQALTDAVLYLHAYPYECAEQLASRILAVAALRDVLEAFQVEGLPARAELEAAVARDLATLAALQNGDGGFPFWRRGGEAWPYVSIHVTHALELARAKGFALPQGMLERARRHLAQIERHMPAPYGAEVRRTLTAYALYVRQRAGDLDPARARALVREAGVESLSFEALGWLLPVLASDPGAKAEADLVRGRFANHVSETAATAHFAVGYADDGAHLLLHSDRRADAIVLEALILDQPENDLIPKLAGGLLAHRTAGRWASTQENAFVLLALDRYFQTYEKTTPDFVARVWLGERYAAEQPFRGRSTDRNHLELPMRLLREQDRADLVLSKQGPGRLYYRIGLRYAPASLVLASADRGFAVERRYEAIDDPDDVRRDAEGVWHVRAGARVRVVVTMVAPARRYHVALVDPLPAGLEAVNPALAVSGSAPPADEISPFGLAPGAGGGWYGTWFEHQNLRDERVEAFSSRLFEGVHRYDYVARATTPGSFVVPPPKAEEMYQPETFGRGSTDRVIVE